MLDTIREVALDLLAASGVAATVRDAHASIFLDFVRTSPPDAVDTELDNVRAGLVWALAHRPQLLDVALVRALTGYFAGRSLFAEAGRALGLIADATVDEATRAWAYHGAGLAANEAGNHAGAIDLAQRSAAAFERLGDGTGRGTALTVAGNAYKALGRYSDAERVHRTVLDVAQAAGDRRRVTIALNNLGTLAHDRGDHAAARDHYARSLRIKRELGDGRGTAVALLNLGALDNDLGRYADAARNLHAAVDLLRTNGEPHSLAFALALLAESEIGLGTHEAGSAAATEALDLARPVGYGPAIGLALSRLGDLALARADADDARRLYQEALDHVTGTSEIARVLERLAATRAGSAPVEAGRLLDRADEIRRTHQTPAPPVDRPLIASTRTRISEKR
jgi:tetratricopeptide (TPR) repeat protein